MTLLKRLQEEAREEYEKENKENNVNVYRVLDITTANTVTAVLDEIEREVDTAWLEELSRKERNQGATAIGLSRAKAIIQSKRTEI